ncbi:MAG: 50S ribosomal protein L18 [Bacteroidetes bacterium]|nr:50S ribosomal protein L18 [Bacteroidota bacterium]
MESIKVIRRKSIRKRIRRIVTGTASRPRLSVFRSNKQIYAQLIDDVNGQTLVAASSRESILGDEKNNKVAEASLVGKVLGERAVAAGLTEVVFDRGGYLYHGRVKSLAEGARNAGLKF